MNKIKKALLYSVVTVLLFVSDRLSKFWVLEHLKDRKISILKCLKINKAVNRGVSFGLFDFVNSDMFMLLSLLIGILIILFIFYTLFEFQKGSNILPEVFVLSGALSNLLDRALYRGVVDFLDFYIYSWHWPTFNLADVFIVVGVFGILGRIFYDEYARKT